MSNLLSVDKEIFDIINDEIERQDGGIELIASENIVSKAVLEAAGSVLTNKYAEGYPNKRYYGGCQFVDKAEQLAIDRLKELYGAEHANVQPHSGSGANMGVYLSVLKPGDKVLGMKLDHGGHLTHGHPINFSGILFDFASYGVNKDTGRIDYDELEKIALEFKPKMIVAGASAYSRIIDFKRFREIADKVGAYFMVDMAHIAGLVAAKLHPNPCGYADFVTTTTHKTLRGPRGGAILCKEKFKKDVDRAIFPGIQGGPLEHIIAAKAVCFKEALQPEFVEYQTQVIKNAKKLGEELIKKGFEIISGGTDNHLLLINVTNKNVTGKEAERLLGEVEITVNKNTIPFDTNSPFVTSGVRIGTPAVTTRGMKEEEMVILADLISETIEGTTNKEDLLKRVKDLCKKFPL